jgi:antitoxin (DNA-binding transcriptional repressor) of toxin-antitoxin stability system
MSKGKTYSIMESQHNLSSVLREVEAGYEVGITRRKQLVARLLPAEEDDRVDMPDFAARAARIWDGGWRGGSSDELLDETRGDQ